MHDKLYFYITLKDVRPNQNRHRVYTIAVFEESTTNQYNVILYWGKIGTTKQRKISYCNDRDELDKLIIGILKTRLQHGYVLVEKHTDTPEYTILSEFRQDNLYPNSQLKIFE